LLESDGTHSNESRNFYQGITMTQIDKVLYTAKTHTTGGRADGSARSSDGRLDIKLTRPGAPGSGTNPEQLFAAGWSACFEGAMALVAVFPNPLAYLLAVMLIGSRQLGLAILMHEGAHRSFSRNESRNMAQQRSIPLGDALP